MPLQAKLILILNVKHWLADDSRSTLRIAKNAYKTCHYLTASETTFNDVSRIVVPYHMWMDGMKCKAL